MTPLALGLGSIFLGLGVLLIVMGWPPFDDLRTTFGSSRQPEGPRLVFPEPVADYGNVPIDKMVTHYFEFTNQGDMPLIIEGEPEVKTVAGC
jgi:hypothetical protein